MLAEQLVIALPQAGDGKVLTAPYSASGISLCCAVLCCAVLCHRLGRWVVVCSSVVFFKQ